MAHENRKKAMLKKYGLKGVNKPKRTPSHKTKSHMVLAQEGHKLKILKLLKIKLEKEVTMQDITHRMLNLVR